MFHKALTEILQDTLQKKPSFSLSLLAYIPYFIESCEKICNTKLSYSQMGSTLNNS